MRLLAVFFVCSVLLCSCSSNNTGFFDYQDNEFDLQCTLSSDGHESNVKITMSAPNESGQRDTVRVEYISPEIIGGYTLEKSNGEYKGKMGNVEIPFGTKTAGIVKRIEAAFALTEDMISDIKAADNGLTEATVISPDISGKISLNPDSSLHRIELSFSDGHSLILTVI